MGWTTDLWGAVKDPFKKVGGVLKSGIDTAESFAKSSAYTGVASFFGNISSLFAKKSTTTLKTADAQAIRTRSMMGFPVSNQNLLLIGGGVILAYFLLRRR